MTKKKATPAKPEPEKTEEKAPEVVDLYPFMMSKEMLGEFATRNEEGYLLEWDPGEPDEEGFYTFTVSVNHEDNLLSDLEAKVEELRMVRTYLIGRVTASEAISVDELMNDVVRALE